MIKDSHLKGERSSRREMEREGAFSEVQMAEFSVTRIITYRH